MISWRPHTFDISLTGFAGPSEVQVDGMVCTEGFGIHTRENRVVVTHLASGKRLVDFLTLGGAMRYVDYAAPYTRDIASWHLAGCTLTEAETRMLQGLTTSAALT